MPRTKEEKKENPEKAVTVRFLPAELRRIDHKAVDEGMQRAPYIRAIFRIGEFFRSILTREFLLEGYDWQDVDTILHGGEPDRDWIKQDVLKLSREVSSKEYQERLLETKRACREVRRLAEVKEDVVDEELDRVEHLLEKE